MPVSFGHVNLMVSDLIKSHDLDQAYNVQASLIPLHHEHIAFSVGAQAVLGLGGSAGAGLPTDHYSSQSVFVVTTYHLDTLRQPLYLSAGVGTHRFAKSFASTSYQALKPLRAWLEYDGWGFNEGVLLTTHVGQGHAKAEFTGTLALVRGRYFTVAVGIGF